MLEQLFCVTNLNFRSFCSSQSERNVNSQGAPVANLAAVAARQWLWQHQKCGCEIQLDDSTMGNQHGHHNGHKDGKTSNSSCNSSHKDISRNNSSPDIAEKPTQLMPVEKLAKVGNLYIPHNANISTPNVKSA